MNIVQAKQIQLEDFLAKLATSRLKRTRIVFGTIHHSARKVRHRLMSTYTNVYGMTMVWVKVAILLTSPWSYTSLMTFTIC